MKSQRYNYLTLEDFLSKAAERHKNKYTYYVREWQGTTTIVDIRCPEHGSFVQRASEHHRGQGCPACGKAKSSTSRKITFEAFEARARKKRGDKFSYYADHWDGMENKTVINCPVHGDIIVHPRDHINSLTGCYQCGNDKIGDKKRLPFDSFVTKANEIHGNRYDYSEVEYTSYKSKIKIGCPEHGTFVRILGKHLTAKRGCPKCKSDGQSSMICDEWLASLQIPELIFEYRLPERPVRVVDGYDPATNTVYQFHGDMWHGNPKMFNPDDINPVTKETYGTAYSRTQRLDNEIIQLGYNLVIQWENGRKKL